MTKKKDETKQDLSVDDTNLALQGEDHAQNEATAEPAPIKQDIKQLMSNEERDAKLAAGTGPKVTKESIEAKIKDFYFFQSPRGGLTTFCIIEMQNGFEFVGKSACVSLENFKADLGQKIAYDDAFRQIWAFEGYLLKEKLDG